MGINFGLEKARQDVFAWFASVADQDVTEGTRTTRVLDLGSEVAELLSASFMWTSNKVESLDAKVVEELGDVLFSALALMARLGVVPQMPERWGWPTGFELLLRVARINELNGRLQKAWNQEGLKYGKVAEDDAHTPAELIGLLQELLFDTAALANDKGWSPSYLVDRTIAKVGNRLARTGTCESGKI